LTPSEHLSFSKPGTYYSLGQGGALGWSLGTALGVKAGAPDKLVICAVGDGSYIFGNRWRPIMSARRKKLPTLTVVYNNEMWNAVRRNTRDVYPDGYAARSNREPLTYFEPGTRYEKNDRSPRRLRRTSREGRGAARRPRPRAEQSRLRPAGALERRIQRGVTTTIVMAR